MSWLTRISPVPPEGVSPLQFLRQLYYDGESVVILNRRDAKDPALVATMREGGRIQTRPFCDPEAVDRWLMESEHPLGIWFLAQPVTGRRHFHSEGGALDYSWRDESAVTSWRWLVVESDSGPAPSLWLRFVCSTRLPVAAIYTSGGKSIHALVRLNTESKAAWDALVRPNKVDYGRLGVDAKSWTAVRLTRLPGCWRAEKQKRQTLLYLNPQITGPGRGSIVERHPGP